MENLKLYRILAWINLLIILVFVSDSFLLSSKTQQEIFNNANYVHTSGRRGNGGYYTFIINTKAGYKYIISRNVGMRLNFGDTLYIEKTKLFNTPLGIIYPTNDKYYHLPLGLFNESYFAHIAIAFISIVSILNLGKKRIIKDTQRNGSLIFTGSAILVVFIIFYFWY